MISMISHENREERKKKRNEKSVRSSSSSSHFIDSCVPERNRGTRFTLLDIPFREPPPPSLSLLIHLQFAISRRRHGIRQCSHDAKCNSNAVSVPVLRASGCGQRSGAEVVANCGTDPRTRPAGNGEELSRMDESSPRVGRFPWLG